tara:strand:- start:152 stop:538 length:387 start_codon:yes stop_codon:yes gene_type:complete
MLSQDNLKDSNIVVIDDSTYKFLLDIDGEVGENYRSFVNKMLTSKIIKRKFLVLNALQRKISRLDTMEGTLDELAEKIKRDINSYTPEQTIEFYQMLSSVYSNDVEQLRKMFLELIKHMVNENSVGKQ